MTMRRGVRRISELPQAVSLGGAIQEVEGVDGVGYQTPLGSAVSILAVTEERPVTPSPYDDEFDTGINALWTYRTGSSANWTQSFSRLLGLGSFELKQQPALASPMRLRLGIAGSPSVAYAGCSLTLQGLTKGTYIALDGGTGGTDRRINVGRLSAAGAWEADLSTNSSGYQSNQAPNNLELQMLIDATNVNFYVGELGSPKYFYQYARSNLGTLSYFTVSCSLGMSLRYFRFDRATTAAAFPLAWAG